MYRHAVPFKREEPSYALVEILLEHGANVNYRVGHDRVSDEDYTIWEMFLTECNRTKPSRTFTGLVALIKLLLHYGADANMRVWKPKRYQGSLTALECLGKLCPPADLGELEEAFKQARAGKSRWLPWKISWLR